MKHETLLAETPATPVLPAGMKGTRAALFHLLRTRPALCPAMPGEADEAEDFAPRRRAAGQAGVATPGSVRGRVRAGFIPAGYGFADVSVTVPKAERGQGALQRWLDEPDAFVFRPAKPAGAALAGRGARA